MGKGREMECENKIKKFKIIEHFINKDFDIECGLYYVETLVDKYYIVQTKDDYKAICHGTGENMFLNIKRSIVKEIQELLIKNQEEK